MIEATTSITNPDLVQAIKNLVKDQTAENQAKVLNEIGTRAKFIAPVVFSNVPVKNSSGGYDLPKDTKLQFRVIANSNGQKFFPAFTDAHQLSKADADKTKSTVVLTFDDYARIILQDASDIDGFVINPYGQMSFIMSRRVIAEVKEKKEATLKRIMAERGVSSAVSDPEA